MSRELTTTDLMTMLEYAAKSGDPMWKGLRDRMKAKFDAEEEFKLALTQQMMETRVQYWDSVAKDELEQLEKLNKEEVSPLKFFETICEDCNYMWCTADWDACPRCRGIKAL